MSACTKKPEDPETPTETVYSITLKRDVLIMMMAYPSLVTGVTLIDGQPYLTLSTGKTLIYDDHKTKTFDEKISESDLQDMLELAYPLGEASTLPQDDQDPGRFRVYAFFDELYGATDVDTSANLTKVTYGTQSLKFSRINGADLALKNVADAIAALTATDTSLKAYCYPSSGTYNYRVISGTSILSMHAYGIAIDLKYNSQDYWQWSDPVKAEARYENYPKTLVHLMEDHGFIWGGKWAHYDMVHYEYRPEILLKARLFKTPIEIKEAWTTGFDLSEPTIKGYADQIDAALKEWIIP